MKDDKDLEVDELDQVELYHQQGWCIAPIVILKCT